MERLMNRANAVLARLWSGSAPMTAAGLLMLAVLVPSLVGLIVDPRIVTGAPVWLKPAKFAISTAIYMLTLAWVFTLLPRMAAHAPGRRVDDCGDPGAGGRDHRPAGVARHDQPLQRRHRARRRALHDHGSGDRRADPHEHRRRRRAVAATIRRRRAWLGSSLGDDHHHRRRQHRRHDDAADLRAARRGARDRSHGDRWRSHGWRAGRWSRPAGHGMESASTAISAFRTSSVCTPSSCCHCSRSRFDVGDSARVDGSV